MRSGPLRHRLALYQPTITEDAYGQQVEGFSKVTEVAAEDASPSQTNMAYARELVAGGADVSLSVRQITIRYRRDITERWQVERLGGRYAGKRMEIKAIREGNKPGHLVLFAQVLNG